MRECAEDASGGPLRWRYGSDSGSSFVGIDAVDVIPIDDPRADETSEELSEEVDGETSPGEFSQAAIREGECWAISIIPGQFLSHNDHHHPLLSHPRIILYSLT